ncbi:MAG: PfaD family polyunsaturated fatty acid/polyketide biosynthesis protein [Gammaproteobacteria bacterium]
MTTPVRLHTPLPALGAWTVSASDVSYDVDGIAERLADLAQACYIVSEQGRTGVASQTVNAAGAAGALPVRAFAQAVLPEQLGDPAFLQQHGVRAAYMAGAMANGIASEELVIALGQQGYLCAFGAAGLVPDRVEQAIRRIQAALPDGPYAFNLIHSPSEPAMERGAVERFLRLGVRTVEASAFLALTLPIVYYRAAGLRRSEDGGIEIGNKVIAKISRTETARRFMEPAPAKLLQKLVDDGAITAEQMALAQRVPMADDITAEADSGGHTDNRPLVTLLPSILALRDEIQAQFQYPAPVRVGVGGGIGTPDAALAAFSMGAAYIVTGSVNQACVQAGASEHTRKLLAEADMADVSMAPAADMFEMGVKLQVLKRGTLFAMRAQKLYELYTEYASIEAIPAEERNKIEQQIFRQNLDEIWAGTQAFFQARDPDQLTRAENNPKRKMALIFRWYLGLSSRWSNSGEPGREMDYQIWSGPSMGAFNAWARGTYLADYRNRSAPDVAQQLLIGACYLARIQQLRLQGVVLDPALCRYVPREPVDASASGIAAAR